MGKIIFRYSTIFLLAASFMVSAYSAVAAVPAAPTGLSPCNSEKDISTAPTLRWNPSPNTKIYCVYIPPFTNFPSFQTNLDLSSAINGLNPNTSYNWWVKACASDNNVDCSDPDFINEQCSSPSSICSFTTKAVPSSNQVTTQPPVTGSSQCQAGQICNPLKYSNFEGLINAIIGFLIKIGAPIAALMFTIAGVIYVTSVGDPGRLKTAQNIMIYTAVGFGVILLASGLIKVVQSLLGG